YASVHPGKKLAGDFRYEVLRTIADPQLAMFRVALVPPKTSGESLTILRTAFADLWKDQQFLADYSKVIKTEPILVQGVEGQEILTRLGSVRREVKEFLLDYINKLTK